MHTKADWRTMESFSPPTPRAFNSHSDHHQWYWVTWGKEPVLCRWDGLAFLPVAGGMFVGGPPKFWMPLAVPAWPLAEEPLKTTERTG